MKKIAFANDHALTQEDKRDLLSFINDLGYETVDCGSNDTVTPYSKVGIIAGELVASGECELGVLVCGTGIGIGIAANKVQGIRSATISKPENASITRLHNDANIIAMGRRDMEISQMKEAIKLFTTTDFEGGRHVERINVITDYEKNSIIK